MKKLYILITAFLLAGCINKVQPITTVSSSFSAPISLETMSNAIYQGSSELGWMVSRVNDNTLKAKLNIRTHEVVVLIKYDTRGYEISYVSSKNMLYSTEDNMIHRKYQQWVNKLNKKIRLEVNMLKAQKQ